MAEQERRRGRSSDVLDAIYERVDDHPERSAQATQLFRARALEQLDVAKEIDNQLPLVARRTWLLVAGGIVLAIAFLVWAALTPSETSIPGQGRIVAAGGIIPVTTAAAGTVTSAVLPGGTVVSAGQPVASIQTDGGAVDVLAPAPGTLWQSLVEVGAGVSAGTPIATMLPAGSDRSAVLIVPESSSGGIRPGQQVSITGGTLLMGTVVGIGAPLTVSDVNQRYAMSLEADTMLVPVAIELSDTAVAGTAATGRVILSNQSVLGRILGRS